MARCSPTSSVTALGGWSRPVAPAGSATPRSRHNAPRPPASPCSVSPESRPTSSSSSRRWPTSGWWASPAPASRAWWRRSRAARPKIADYPFTTLVPNLGVVEAGRRGSPIADVPGLIPGASEGKGLGHEFLRHIERCAVLVHVLDCATLEPDRDPLTDLDALEAELAAYGGLADRPRAGRAQQGRRSRGPRAGRPGDARPARSAAGRSSPSRRSATRGFASCCSPWPRSSQQYRRGPA